MNLNNRAAATVPALGLAVGVSACGGEPEVEADVDRLVESAASEYENEIDAVQSARQGLTASVEAATQAPSGPAITQVSADFGGFATAVDDLREAVGGAC